MSPADLLIAEGRKQGVESIVKSFPHSVLMYMAQTHAEYQAEKEQQGHQGFPQRAESLQSMFPYCQTSEICAESWPGQTLDEAVVDAYKSWKSSEGHWKECNTAHTFYGYGIALGKNAVWYSCGLFVDTA